MLPWTYILNYIYPQTLKGAIDHHTVFHQLYADDTQIYKSCLPTHAVATIYGEEQCISDVISRITCNMLEMNDDKTEAMMITRQKHSFYNQICET